MTSAEHALSELLRHAARRVRDDGRFERQTALAEAPPRLVDVGPIADLLTAAVTTLAPYEGRGWDEAKILARLSEMDRTAIVLARAIVDPERGRTNYVSWHHPTRAASANRRQAGHRTNSGPLETPGVGATW